MSKLNHTQIISKLSKQSQQNLVSLKVLESIDSTNTYVLNQVDYPIACLAEYQTAGRGRLGRQWISPYGSGICLSIKHSYSKPNFSLNGLNIALTVTIMRVLRAFGAIDVGIKWPNDILWQAHKLAGLLLESRYISSRCDVVIGIGLNVKKHNNQSIDQAWVDLETILGQTISRNDLAAALIDHCLQTLISYPTTGLSAYQQDWHRFDLSYGKIVTLKIPVADGEYKLITAKANGIDEQGALQVGEHKYVYGEVSLSL
jgi:BirA family biotin operon repressor/biotin-[acetyl-CoA-carboxylase] ligase